MLSGLHFKWPPSATYDHDQFTEKGNKEWTLQNLGLFVQPLQRIPGCLWLASAYIGSYSLSHQQNLVYSLSGPAGDRVEGTR